MKAQGTGGAAVSNEMKAVLHVAKAHAGFDEETYRAFLNKHAGVCSSVDLTPETFNKVMIAFERETGFVSTAKRRKRSKARARHQQPDDTITTDQQQLIRSLYEEMGWSELARQMGFSKRCCKKSFPQTRNDANKVIEGLKAMIARQQPHP